jgi:hypothetical protein
MMWLEALQMVRLLHFDLVRGNGPGAIPVILSGMKNPSHLPANPLPRSPHVEQQTNKNPDD